MRHGVYGLPLPELVTIPQDALQFSPTIPGSACLEDYREGTLAGMAMLAPAGTLERQYAIALALRAITPQSTLTVLALKDKGGLRLGKELAGFGCSVSETSRRHYRICLCRKPDLVTGMDEALAAGAMRWDAWLNIWTQPGVFSWNRIDPGSALLARELPMLSGQGADLGCGIGYLSAAILSSPQVRHLALIDIDRRAVAAAKRNVDDPRVNVHWGDVRASMPFEKLDFVVMNPPFHDGGIEDQSLGQAFIRRASESLRPGGVCWLIANRHLPYEAVVQSHFRRFSIKAQAEGYKIYEAHR